MRTISVVNLKGGCGKTTLSGGLGSALRKSGARVLLIDLDPQCNLSAQCRARIDEEGSISSFDVLMRRAAIDKAIQQIDGIDIISSSVGASTADIALTKNRKEYRLKEAVSGLSDRYDYLIIDTPPALGVLTINALTASDGCLIATEAAGFSMQGISTLSDSINMIREYCNADLRIYGLVLGRFNGRTTLSKQVVPIIADYADQLGTRLFESKIRNCTAIAEAQTLRQDILDYAPRGNAAIDFQSVAEELIGIINARER